MILRQTFSGESRDLRKRTAAGRSAVTAFCLLAYALPLLGAGHAFAAGSLEDIGDLSRVVAAPIVALPAPQERPMADGGSVAGQTAGTDEARCRAMVTGTWCMAPGEVVAGRLPELTLGEPPAPLVKPVLVLPEPQKNHALPKLALPGLRAEEPE